MGASFSSVFPSLNMDTKTVLNTLLKRLVTDIDLRDMYSLADPRMCKEYIVVATTGLDKLFKAIRINKTKDGVLLFQKIKGIQYANPDPAKQKQYCTELAFFYVRIFQIYAAVALSIMDSELPDSDPIMQTKQRDTRGVVFIRPEEEGFKGFKQRALPTSIWSRLKGAFQKGGELRTEQVGLFLPDTVAPYNILNRFLMAPTDTESPMRMKNPGPGGIYSLTTDQKSIYDFDASGVRVGAKNPMTPRLIYKTASANMTIEGAYKVTLKNFKINNVDYAETRDRDFNEGNLNNEFLRGVEQMFDEVIKTTSNTFSAVDFLKTRGIIESRTTTSAISGSNTVYVMNPAGSLGSALDIVYQGSHKYKNGDKERSERVRIYTDLNVTEERGSLGEKQYRLRVTMDNIRTEPDDLIDELNLPAAPTKLFSDARIPIDTDGRTIGAYLDRFFKKMLVEKDEYEARDGIYRTRDGLTEPLDSESIPSTMRIKDVWKALAKKPAVVAHCKARALQLLNLAAIKGYDEGAYSSMCLTKFPLAKDGSVPPAGQPITEEYGIKALAMLFVDKMLPQGPQITDTNEYRQFRVKFKEYFERVELQEGEKEPEKFSDVREKLMPGICEGHTKDRVLVGDAAYALRQKARELFSRQATHVGKSMRLLFKLFDEYSIRRGEFALSKYVERDGMAAIDKIAEEARNMLVEYYGDCEQRYKEGLFIMYNKYKANPESIDYKEA
jgi:hypothetical protein